MTANYTTEGPGRESFFADGDGEIPEKQLTFRPFFDKFAFETNT